MKKFYGSLFLKLLAFVMVCIITPFFIGCCFFATEAYEDGMYLSGKTPEFEQTYTARNFINSKLVDINEYIYWNDISGLKKNEYRFDDKNFAYKIYDKNGKEIVSTLKTGIIGREDIHSPEESGSTGYILMIEDFATEEVDEEGKTTATYTMEGYLKMPMDPNAAGYNEYVKFSFIA